MIVFVEFVEIVQGVQVWLVRDFTDWVWPLVQVLVGRFWPWLVVSLRLWLRFWPWLVVSLRLRLRLRP